MKQPPTSARRRMKASCDENPLQAGLSGLILLLGGEERSGAARHLSTDECRRTGLLTPGFEPRPRLPSRETSGCWGFVARYSGATVPDSHGVPVHPSA